MNCPSMNTQNCNRSHRYTRLRVFSNPLEDFKGISLLFWSFMVTEEDITDRSKIFTTARTS